MIPTMHNHQPNHDCVDKKKETISTIKQNKGNAQITETCEKVVIGFGGGGEEKDSAFVRTA